MRSLLKKIAALIALSCVFGGYAAATPIIVEPTSDGSSVEATIDSSLCLAPCTIITTVSVSLDDVWAALEVGEQWEFDFFDITVGGWGIATATIEATLAFLEPEIFVAASGDGSFFTFFGLLSGGSLVWEQPAFVTLSDGTELAVSFEDIYFEVGSGGTTTVSAFVGRYHPVPEPGTLALFGIGLLVLGLTSRKAIPSARPRRKRKIRT